jgi:hypothetical protein
MATLAVACSTALAIAVSTAQAKPAQTATSACKITIVAAPWHVGAHSGNKYTVAGKGMSCTAARSWITRATHQPATAPIKGPSGYICHSFSTPASGDKLQYSGVCMHPPHNTPFIEWAPKISST